MIDKSYTSKGDNENCRITISNLYCILFTTSPTLKKLLKNTIINYIVITNNKKIGESPIFDEKFPYFTFFVYCL